MSRPSLTPSDKKFGSWGVGRGECREVKAFKEIKEFREIKEIGVGGYFSLISLISLNSLNSQSFSPLTKPVKKWWLLCIVKQNDKPKTTTTMKLNYTIDCRHCGTHTEYSIVRHYRTMSDAEAAGKMHIDTECAMRCPACRYRLNTTEADFRSQVHITREA